VQAAVARRPVRQAVALFADAHVAAALGELEALERRAVEARRALVQRVDVGVEAGAQLVVVAPGVAHVLDLQERLAREEHVGGERRVVAHDRVPQPASLVVDVAFRRSRRGGRGRVLGLRSARRCEHEQRGGREREAGERPRKAEHHSEQR
jgi:hypothetical protein